MSLRQARSQSARGAWPAGEVERARCPSRDGDAAVAVERAQSGCRRTRGGGDQRLRQPRFGVGHLGDPREVGRHRSRAEGGDADAVDAQLLVERLGERRDRRFGRRVHGDVGHRLVAGHRRDDQHRAPPPGGHRRRELSGQRHGRLEVGPHHQLQPIRVLVDQLAPHAETRAQHEHVDLEAGRPYPLDQPPPGHRLGHVARRHLNVPAVFGPQLTTELLEQVRSTGDQDQVVAPRRQLPGELAADARRRAR